LSGAGSAALRAAWYWSDAMMPCWSIWSSTTRRRSFAAFGFVTGSKSDGSRGIPARSAASGSVSLLAGFWK
jgi:hypothetical protein